MTTKLINVNYNLMEILEIVEAKDWAEKAYDLVCADSDLMRFARWNDLGETQKRLNQAADSLETLIFVLDPDNHPQTVANCEEFMQAAYGSLGRLNEMLKLYVGDKTLYHEDELENAIPILLMAETRLLEISQEEPLQHQTWESKVTRSKEVFDASLIGFATGAVTLAIGLINSSQDAAKTGGHSLITFGIIVSTISGLMTMAACFMGPTGEQDRHSRDR